MTRLDALTGRPQDEMFRALIQATGEAVWDWDMEGRLEWHHSAYARTLGIDAMMRAGEIAAWEERVHPDDRQRVVAGLDAAARTEASWRDEYRLRRDDGSYAIVVDRGTVVRDESGRAVRMVGTIRDVSESRRGQHDLREAVERLRHQATHDSLTGLANRDLLYERLADAIVDAEREGHQVAVLHLDLDRFKVVNDGFGHPFGDLVLREVGERLRTQVWAADTVARLGGDEFAVVAPVVVRVGHMTAWAGRILQSFAEPFEVEGRCVHLGASIGVSLYPDHGSTPAQLVDNADTAMYYAKDAGRNAFRVFTPLMAQETQRRIDLETKLRAAAEEGQLSLAYQPKVEVRSGAVVGCEALLRWEHPELGSVDPSDFIPIAEDSGLILPIGEWALREACRQGRAWIDAGLPRLSVAVNLSTVQLRQGRPAAWVGRILEETGFPAELLELELTESQLAEDADTTVGAVRGLRELGVSVAIDDFGTGYSSLDYLRRFDVTALKIDQSFVHRMLGESGDAAIVRAAVALGHALGLTVIAEGVEVADELALLRLLQCDQVQGYLLGRPVPAAEFEALLPGQNA
ncbi:MAG: EAL domain-containing protein [Nocardioides sp.]|uniref:putative bifunctional diguanylate cyclase/phosphodiesterase n=1 Tax=Nocardioides sp. TaxID=35761 RepID=UPI0039E292AB